MKTFFYKILYEVLAKRDFHRSVVSTGERRIRIDLAYRVHRDYVYFCKPMRVYVSHVGILMIPSLRFGALHDWICVYRDQFQVLFSQPCFVFFAADRYISEEMSQTLRQHNQTEGE